MSVNLTPFPLRTVSFSNPQSWLEPLRSTSSNSTASAGTVHRPNHRQVSGTPFKSVSSTPLEPNLLHNENRDPARPSLRVDDQPVDVLVPKSLQRKLSRASSHKSCWGTDIPAPPRSRGSSIVQESGPLEDVDLGSPCGLSITGGKGAKKTESSEAEHLLGIERISYDQTDSVERIGRNDEVIASQTTPAIDDEHPFRRWVQTLKRRKLSVPLTSAVHVEGWLSEGSKQRSSKRFSGNDFLTIPQFHKRHSKRSSIASSGLVSNGLGTGSHTSSGFVTGFKSATVSLDGSGFLPRSRRNTQLSSDERRANRSSHLSYGEVRASNDSGRPLMTNSIDDAAWNRAVKRRQTVQEILRSEESYVADMKALVNVYFTLLASTPALSNRTRSSIQNNVMEILHTHEELLKKLHRVIVCSDACTIAEEPKRRHVRWKSLDLTSSRRCRYDGHRKRRSIGIPDSWTVSLTAEPSEATEVAQVFNEMMSRFFAYHEYCAKYDMMVQDVASTYKNVSGWHAYEIGIEALSACLTSINSREGEGKKGLTFSDLLIKPIQRICKYPLFFGDLLKYTPVVDCPESHAEIEKVLGCLRETVREINKATNDREMKGRMQRTWRLQERLLFADTTPQTGIFRTIGHALLCGVLHVAYQTRNSVNGEYMLCALFNSYMLLATADEDQQMFRVAVFIHISDVKIESSEDGKGLQCHTAPYSWKLVFESDNCLFELILSACSMKEEEAWKSNIVQQSNAESQGQSQSGPVTREVFSTTTLDLRPAGQIFGQPGTLARRLSIQRAATVGTKSNVCQIIIRNTQAPKDGNEQRYPLSPSLSRSQSLLATHRIPILAPKRADRIRLEQVLQEIWTKDILPYPGMVAARGDQIKASANSVMRKLSFVSMSGAFAKRSSSFTRLAPCKSTDEGGSSTLTEEAALGLSEDGSRSPVISTRGMSIQISRDDEMLLPQAPVSPASSPNGFQRLRRAHTKKFRSVSKKLKPSPAASTERSPKLAEDEKEDVKTKKRWSNPFYAVKSMSTDGMKFLGMS